MTDARIAEMKEAIRGEWPKDDVLVNREAGLSCQVCDLRLPTLFFGQRFVERT
ncbi:hypothetical protein HFO56_39410 [Rhizobium laguerreae]|uniref:hypothetical protein n=1 Tax=Rhizobium laguerreae TaxID=1076926 RepID=UPI001C9118C2|nr:hypothetical protein [Rhizobium laguerreae]MBY3158370.1 hypothetical protein [Rhizobium laguerreae]